MCLFLSVSLRRRRGEGHPRERGSRSASTCWICYSGSVGSNGVRRPAMSGRHTGKVAGARRQRYLVASEELNFILKLLLNPSKQGSDVIRF